MLRPDSGMVSGRCLRKSSSERRMRRRETFAWMSARAARSTMRSWNEKRYSRRGPRVGVTKPTSMRLRMVLRGRCRTRSMSRTLYDCIGRPGKGLPTTGLACGLRRLLDALGFLARAELGGRLFRRLGAFQAGAQRLHQIDDLAAALGFDFGHGDLLSFDFLLDFGLDAAAVLVGVRVRIEALGSLLLDQLLRELHLLRFDLGLGNLDFGRRAHVRGEVQLLHRQHVVDRTDQHDVRLAARRPATDG